MFIDKVTMKDLNSFTNQIKAKINKIVVVKNKIYLQLSTKDTSMGKDLWISDFDVEFVDGKVNKVDPELSKIWRKIMFNKLGEEYRLNFNRNAVANSECPSCF